ncbi:MAG: hypothetical protein LBR87_05530 [Synergistaceae bacterium]|jgi:hypothetical protein|nr:hypothetical protein [Synergistaceae bacterium]
MKYLLSPAVLFVPIILVSALFGEGLDMESIPPVMTVGAACIFIIMLSFYVILCGKGKMKAAYSASGLANGMLVIFASAAFRCGTGFSLLGFVIVLAGMLNAMTLAVPSGETLFVRKSDRIVPSGMGADELSRLIDSIQFPCVFMEKDKDGAERIIAYNASFADDFKLDRKGILGSSLESLLPGASGASQMKYGAEEWVIKRTVKGRQVLLMLSPAAKQNEASKIEVFDAIDPSTGLYAESFMKYKAKSDVESVNRGRRRMSAALINISFPRVDPLTRVNDDDRLLASVIFCRLVLQSIRVCDSAYRTGDFEVLLLMPDTPSSGSEVVMSRIYDAFRRTSAIECPSLSSAILDYVCRDYIGGKDLPAWDKILEELSIALCRKNPDLAAGVRTP